MKLQDLKVLAKERIKKSKVPITINRAVGEELDRLPTSELIEMFCDAGRYEQCLRDYITTQVIGYVVNEIRYEEESK